MSYPAARPSTGSNAVAAVSDVTYLGSGVRVEVDLDMGSRVIARRSLDQTSELRLGRSGVCRLGPV